MSASILFLVNINILYKIEWPNSFTSSSSTKVFFCWGSSSFSEKMEDDEVILLDFWLSPYGMRVRIALEEKGIKYEWKNEDLSNKSTLLLQMNPVHKKIPVLIHNGKPICESLTALEYIDEVWNDKSPTLLPSDPYQRAQARFWTDFVDKKVYETSLKFWKTEAEEEIEAAKKELLEWLKILEQEIGDKAYFGGDNIGLVDVALVPMFFWFYSYNVSGKFNFINETLFPNIIAWAKKCTQREGVSKCFPEEHKVKEYLQRKMVSNTK